MSLATKSSDEMVLHLPHHISSPSLLSSPSYWWPGFMYIAQVTHRRQPCRATAQGSNTRGTTLREPEKTADSAEGMLLLVAVAEVTTVKCQPTGGGTSGRLHACILHPHIGLGRRRGCVTPIRGLQVSQIRCKSGWCSFCQNTNTGRGPS
jgi:hypothetical protein